MGSKLVLIALVLSAGCAFVYGEEYSVKEEMEFYKIAIDFLDECGSKDLSLCFKVSQTLVLFFNIYSDDSIYFNYVHDKTKFCQIKKTISSYIFKYLVIKWRSSLFVFHFLK